MSAGIAFLAHRSRALSRSGALAAIGVGTACTTAGWSWAWLLIAFFASATVLSRTGESLKRERLAGIPGKGANRDARQVLANGGVFALLAITSLFSHSAAVEALAAAALAASTGDTWATELGTLSREMPRSILSMNVVPRGTSGGVTVVGVAASIAGGGLIALVASLAGWSSTAVCAALAGGFGGSLIDSILGATVQQKRWCEQCGRGTERAVHDCGTRTVHRGGMRWVDNDVVNFLSSIGGAMLGLLCLN